MPKTADPCQNFKRYLNRIDPTRQKGFLRSPSVGSKLCVYIEVVARNLETEEESFLGSVFRYLLQPRKEDCLGILNTTETAWYVLVSSFHLEMANLFLPQYPGCAIDAHIWRKFQCFSGTKRINVQHYPKASPEDRRVEPEGLPGDHISTHSFEGCEELRISDDQSANPSEQAIYFTPSEGSHIASIFRKYAYNY